jgi:protein tyrosine phosphatase
MKFPFRRAALVTVAGAALVATGIIVWREVRWKKFDVVQSGVIHRSGYLKPHQLKRAAETYGIRTVFSFTWGGHDEEEKVCREIGITRHFHYLAGNGVGPDDPYLRFLEVVADSKNHPILVHCSAGVQRTGGAVCLYRVLHQGRDFDESVREMIAFGNEGLPAQVEQLRRIVDRYRRAPSAATLAAPPTEEVRR